jgi:hypothetical protein
MQKKTHGYYSTVYVKGSLLFVCLGLGLCKMVVGSAV